MATTDGSWVELLKLQRCANTAIYDRVRDRMVVFGGYDGVSVRNDVWALTLSGSPAWTQHTPGLSPSARYFHTAIYDPGNDRMVVFWPHVRA